MPFQTNSLRKKLVFCGTPGVAAEALELIYKKTNHALQIVAVVTQPPTRARRGGGKPDTPSAVHECALKLGIPVLTPDSAKDEKFLEVLEELKPDLCLTAAYGNFLPKRFLNIPKFGTLNIHPSLLPLYRGASPVQRALENGDTETGVSLLFSTLVMDAGPIFMQEKYAIDDKIKASELLKKLFILGAELFVKNFQKIFLPNLLTHEQNHSNATHAQKISKEEGILNFEEPAHVCHNKVRAFDIWPKTIGKFFVDGEQKELKIITTEVVENVHSNAKIKDVFFTHDAIDICCGDNKFLRIKEIQEPSKKVMTAGEYINGLHGRKLICL